jgi:hypothetical protein
MSNQSYTTSFVVEQTPDAVFDAINNVRGWWSGEITGDTDRLGAEFTYRVPDVHYCRMRITELVRGKKVVWQVLDSDLLYTEARTEWSGTTIGFEMARVGKQTEVRFTHTGLLPDHECYGSCSTAWRTLVHRNLRMLIATGEDQPDAFAAGA